MRKYLFPILAIMLALFLLEVGARVFYTIQTDIREYHQQMREMKNEWWKFSPDIGWERRPNFSGEVYEIAYAFDKNGYFTSDSAELNDKTIPKILLIGDSCTFGNGVEVKNTFGEFLEQILPAYDIINLAVPGHSSYQGVKVLEKYIARIKPGIILASFNYNDRRYVLSPDSIDSRQFYRKVYTSTRATPFIKSYLFCMMRSGYDTLMKAFKKTDHTQIYWIDTMYPRVSPQDYRANFIKMIELAQQHHAQMMFLTLLDNPSETLFLRQGLELLQQGRDEDAIVKFNEGIDSKALSILARKYLADLYQQQNQLAESNALRQIKKPFFSLHGGTPLFLDSEYEAIIQILASDYNIPLIEGGKALQEHPEYYMDICHFDTNGHLLLAKLIADVIKDRQKADE